MQCPFVITPLADGRYRHACPECGRELIVRSPRLHAHCGASAAPPPLGGPGTEMKKMLARIGIVPTAGCKCNARAAEMDRRGVAWCRANLDTIVGWLREEAAARGLPFLDFAARRLILRAASWAERKAAASGKSAE